MKRMVGSKIFDAYYPERYYNHDAEDPDGMVELERTSLGEVVAINRRAAESDLLIYVNINLVPMDGGHKSVGTGLANYESLRAHHNPKTIRDSESYMEPSRSALHKSTERIGRVIDKNAEGVPHRDRAEQPDVRRSDGLPGEAGGGLHRVRPAEVPGAEVHAVQAAAGGEAEAVHADPGALPGDRGATRGRPSPATRRRSSCAGSSTRCRWRVRATSSSSRCRTSPRTT